MKIAIMQPYLFPYFGYFQLINSVDKFIIYDDVNFIKQGWINRNRILINGVVSYFTIPVKDISSFNKINNTFVCDFPRFKKKFIKQIEQNYCKSENFDVGIQYVKNVLEYDGEYISELAIRSVLELTKTIGLERKFFTSSKTFKNKESLERADRIISIVKELGATDYINSEGGKQLYKKEQFKEYDVNLHFLKPQLLSYPQIHNDTFQPGLSIIDVIMNNSIKKVSDLITHYQLD